MKISRGKLKKLIREACLRESRPFRMPSNYYDPPDGPEIPDSLYDDLEDIFERAATDPNGKTEFRGPDGYYTLEDDSLEGDGQYILIDPGGKEEIFYARDKSEISALEDRILSLFMQAGGFR